MPPPPLPQIMVEFMTEKGPCQPETGTCHLIPQRLNHGRCSCWPPAPLKGVQGGNQEGGTLCSGKKGQNRPSERDLSRRFYESQFLHLFIHRQMTSLTVTSALVIKENITMKSQNRVAMVQTSKEITRWHYGCNFRLVLVLLKTWAFWVVFDLDATRHSQNNVCWQLATTTLLFINLENWLPGYKSS